MRVCVCVNSLNVFNNAINARHLSTSALLFLFITKKNTFRPNCINVYFLIFLITHTHTRLYKHIPNYFANARANGTVVVV